MASYRHLARITAFQAIFSKEEGSKVGPKEILESLLIEQGDRGKDCAEFARHLLDEVLNHREEIIKIIETYAPEWPFAMISAVDRAVLMLGTCELVFTGKNEDVPVIVAIDEAIEIAKNFGGENSGKFVNGVLSSVMEKYLKIKK